MKSLNPVRLSESEKRDILVELEADHTTLRNNQREIRRRWVKVQNAVMGRQLFPEGGNNVSGAIAMGHEEAGAASATRNVDDESLIFNDLRRVKNVNQQRLTSYFIRPEVVPNSKDPADKNGARVGRMVLADHIRQTGEEKIKATVADELIHFNVSILKVHFDPHAGRMIKKPKQFKVFGMPLWTLGRDIVPEGEMKWSFPNPKCVLLPKYCRRVEDADEIEEYHVETIQRIYRDYGVVVKPESVETEYLDTLDLSTKRDVEGGADAPKLLDRAILKEKMIMPCPRFPEGALFTWTKDMLIRSDKLRYPGNPYFSAQLMFQKESAYTDSILWDLLPVQGFMNLGYSAMGRWLKMVSLLRRWIPDTCKVNPDELNNATGMNSVFYGEKAPSWEQIPDLNETFFKLIELGENKMSSLGYANELAKQKRGMSGNALGILQEVDDTIFKPALEQIQSMYSRAASFHLKVAAECISNPRLVKISSKQGWQTEEWKGEVLEGNSHAEINLLSGLPTNKVMRLEYLSSLLDKGAIDQDEFKAFMEFPSDTQPLEDMQKQYEIADRVIKELLDFPANYEKTVDKLGNEIYVCKTMYHDFDNHPLILTKLTETMQESFDKWTTEESFGELGFWVQKAFNDHRKFHMMEVARMMGPAPNGPGAAAGGPGGTAGPGKPLPGAKDSAAGTSLRDSAQNPIDQPSRDAIPDPMATGFTA